MIIFIFLEYCSSTFKPPLESDGFALPINKLKHQLLAAEASEKTHQAIEVSLRDSLMYIQSILDTLRTPVLVLDSDLKIKTASRAFYQTFTILPEQTENCFIYDLQEGAWNIPSLRVALEEILPQQNSFEDFEVTHDFPGLGQRVVILSGSKLWREGNHAMMIVLVMEDITIRKKVEEELLRSNEDLQRFAYVAAHDLRTPLAAALGAAEILSMRIRGRLDEMENKMLAISIDSMKRIATLMKDILSYSVAQAELKTNHVISLSEPLQIALDNLCDEIRTSGAIIHYEGLPTISVDRTQLVLIFQNIIGNAIKYRSMDRIPDIKISALKQGPLWLISIADNGEGFYPEQANQIFYAFARLQTTKQGSGIGLTTCKRIVERMNGNIWAESIKDQGSVFYFTLPE
jgi:signal transduction histidine kinase